MENIISKKATYILMVIGLIIFILVKLYFDYQNIKAVNFYLDNQLSKSIGFDKIGKGLRLINQNTSLHVYDADFSYCGSEEIYNELEDKVTPNSVVTKLFVTKDKKSNLFKTVINDTCYQFKVYADSGWVIFLK